VTDNGLLLLSSEGGGALAHPCLIQGLACGSHDGDKSLLLSMCGSCGGLSHGRGVVLLRLGGGDDCGGGGGGSLTVEWLELLPGMVSKMVVVGGGEP
jgi:hypothetical protein